MSSVRECLQGSVMCQVSSVREWGSVKCRVSSVCGSVECRLSADLYGMCVSGLPTCADRAAIRANLIDARHAGLYRGANGLVQRGASPL